MGTKKKESKEKPLEKMTAKELRDVALTIPQITGVHGMNKVELISAVKKNRGIEEGPVKQTDSSDRDINKKIKALKVARETAVETSDLKMALIYRRRITRLKKKTRRAA